MAGLFGGDDGYTEVNLGGRHWIPLALDWMSDNPKANRGTQLLKRLAEARQAGVDLSQLSPEDQRTVAAYAPSPWEKLANFFGGPAPEKYVTEPRTRQVKSLPKIPEAVFLKPGEAEALLPIREAKAKTVPQEYFFETQPQVKELSDADNASLDKTLKKLGVPAKQWATVKTQFTLGVKPEKTVEESLAEAQQSATLLAGGDKKLEKKYLQAILLNDSTLLKSIQPPESTTVGRLITTLRGKGETDLDVAERLRGTGQIGEEDFQVWYTYNSHRAEIDENRQTRRQMAKDAADQRAEAAQARAEERGAAAATRQDAKDAEQQRLRLTSLEGTLSRVSREAETSYNAWVTRFAAWLRSTGYQKAPELHPEYLTQDEWLQSKEGRFHSEAIRRAEEQFNSFVETLLGMSGSKGKKGKLPIPSKQTPRVPPRLPVGADRNPLNRLRMTEE